MAIHSWWSLFPQGFFISPERSLEKALAAAQAIQAIEDQYFQGQKVSAQSGLQDTPTTTYWINRVQADLQTLQTHFIQFQKSRLFRALKNVEATPPDVVLTPDQVRNYLETLGYLEAVLKRYDNFLEPGALVSASASSPSPPRPMFNPRKARQKQKDSFRYIREPEANQKLESASRKTGILPRSFLRTLNRIKQEISPPSEVTENQVLQQYQDSRRKTTLSVKFILLLIIIPLLTHQLTKTFFLAPVVAKYFDSHLEVVFLNQTMEEEALAELRHFEESLRFRSLLGLGEKLSPEATEEKVREKAQEISQSYRQVGANAIANIFADFASLMAFCFVLFTSRQEIEIVKDFIDELVYGLSDSAKAFLIILFTDMFVGFHSPHGWEVILENLARHFGLPENRDFNFLFIATFPVILDTVFKYWIFRYLNSISPSAVATYRNMNE
ncbi:MAG: proton extrusion protein PcxA [Microcystaceae cyanobacterium]